MSKLLKEAQIRRFMALANIGALSDTFVNEDSPYPAHRGIGKGAYVKENDEWGDDEGDESEIHPGELDFEGGEEVEDLEVADAEVDADVDIEDGPGVEVPEEVAVDVITTIANALEAEYGLAVDVQAGADLGPEEAEAELDVGPPAVDGDELEAEVELGDVEVVDDEEVVAEVLRRVTKRLRAALKKERKTRIQKERKTRIRAKK